VFFCRNLHVVLGGYEEEYSSLRFPAVLRCAKLACERTVRSPIKVLDRMSFSPVFLGRFLPKLGGASCAAFFLRKRKWPLFEKSGAKTFVCLGPWR
jgi:hypothetical protein